jgi:hypothetical protein
MLGEIPKEPPSGAKARHLLSAICGPTEVVPLLQNRLVIEFLRSLFRRVANLPSENLGFSPLRAFIGIWADQLHLNILIKLKKTQQKPCNLALLWKSEGVMTGVVSFPDTPITFESVPVIWRCLSLLGNIGTDRKYLSFSKKFF